MREIRNILFVTLTNIGDVILSLPTLDLLRGLYPGAEVTVLAGPRAASLFHGNAAVTGFVPFDKHAPLREKLKLFRSLRARDFDLVVDLRNSLFGYALGRKHMPLLSPPPRGTHSWERHLSRARFLMRKGRSPARKGSSIVFREEDRQAVELLLKANGLSGRAPIVISPGARSTTKCWPKEKFRALAEALVKEHGPLLLVGDGGDKAVTGYISGAVPGAVDIAGKTSLLQLAYLLTRSAVLIANDSANMHLASYLDVPIVAIVGPSDDLRYGPWSRRSLTVKKDIPCRPCQKAQCPLSTMACLTGISVEDVKNAVARIMGGNRRP